MKDKLSALIDGDLDQNAIRPVFDGLRRDASLRKDWDAYCLIGDVIRGERAGSADFVARVMAGLDEEPIVFAPAVSAAASARRSVLRTLMPIAASVMGVAAVGLVAATLYSQEAPTPATLAVQRIAAQPVVASAPASGVLARVQGGGGQNVADDPLREYVFAHQGVSGGPMPAAVQYVRTVSASSEGPGR
ncbi:sigma-E factor negative regulatory protein [Thauera linaloolentis]|uniref:Anti sigma-E protein, RseA n=1 Tax=Thauera linaloolentis (strain DSM 12138 / JCM 21573 / CCUG 41526 / CIP 105981 / IAM 15112 / NBRC 102519 / 47Lol) TaxID=1123367 RepID=N6Z8R3_THAL4|nr:sigma-E factor negative regulatory protein [Thauera linaloolentis]ENO88544.1 anti sigma-E protein, RseA [Thauera linaloolentis 47Lol = DSM 12138]MCM8564878.1 sigma-E factor negative regulatory protein [Thauera linaloolentis]